MEKNERRYWEYFQRAIPNGFPTIQTRIKQVLDWEATNTIKTATLNDLLRCAGSGGQVLATSWITQLQQNTQRSIYTLVRNFSDFNEGNDPYWEHDFWAIKSPAGTINFKIDYYDQDNIYASEDPGNPAITNRVMTIMLASEY